MIKFRFLSNEPFDLATGDLLAEIMENEARYGYSTVCYVELPDRTQVNASIEWVEQVMILVLRSPRLLGMMGLQESLKQAPPDTKVVATDLERGKMYYVEGVRYGTNGDGPTILLGAHEDLRS